MKHHTAQEVRDYLWQELNLATRSITFHVFHTAYDPRLYVGGGIVDCSGDLYECDRFFDVGYERSDEAEIEIDWVESWLIGDGEAEHADSDEAWTLELLAQESPAAFDAFIREYADPLTSVTDFTLENPAFDQYAITEDDDDE